MFRDCQLLLSTTVWNGTWPGNEGDIRMYRLVGNQGMDTKMQALS